MKRIMAVYDVDPFYADRFAEYANEKGKTPFTVVAFGSLSKLHAFAEQQPVEILLAGGNVSEETLKGIRAEQLIRLSEDGRELYAKGQKGAGGADSAEKTEGGTAGVVYKYQATDAVLREVMACYQLYRPALPIAAAGTRSEIIGVYSPAGRCGKTGFCLTLGQALAKDEKVLYLNLEEYSGLEAMMGTKFEGSISDLVYYFRQGDYNRLRLEAVTYSWYGLDYVPPAPYAEDLAEMKGEELARLVSAIAGDGMYDVIIVDIGNLGRSAEPLLELCSVIYVPVPDDCISAAKAEAWNTYLENTGRNHIRERTQYLKLPEPKQIHQAQSYPEQLRWGAMGEYVKNLLRQRKAGGYEG